eukprot:TRINITY_DN22243_c0_g1_i3.p1 TRINITY_DN22243_c0_g1~~TRINITY_DN22243_c0_g1_i3.p1  ORF type:complete len:113 (+),score=20.48 TRINITY_DN22243_c0_g1_i3:128-466(+)
MKPAADRPDPDELTAPHLPDERPPSPSEAEDAPVTAMRVHAAEEGTAGMDNVLIQGITSLLPGSLSDNAGKGCCPSLPGPCSCAAADPQASPKCANAMFACCSLDRKLPDHF